MNVAAARPITTSSHYSGRLVQDCDSGWSLICFLGAETGGDFRGVISDPVPVRVGTDGYLAVEDAQFDPMPLKTATHRTIRGKA
jgi:beta-fructofuranosidase